MAIDEASKLLGSGDGEPELDQRDAVEDELALKSRGVAKERVVLLGLAKAHHALDAGPVVPGPVEQHDLPAGWQMRQVPAQVVVALLVRGGLLQGDDPGAARIQVLREPPDRTALARGVATLEDH